MSQSDREKFDCPQKEIYAFASLARQSLVFLLVRTFLHHIIAVGGADRRTQRSVTLFFRRSFRPLSPPPSSSAPLCNPVPPAFANLATDGDPGDPDDSHTKIPPQRRVQHNINILLDVHHSSSDCPWPLQFSLMYHPYDVKAILRPPPTARELVS